MCDFDGIRNALLYWMLCKIEVRTNGRMKPCAGKNAFNKLGYLMQMTLASIPISIED